MSSRISRSSATVVAFLMVGAIARAQCDDECVCKRNYVQVTLGQGFTSIDSSGSGFDPFGEIPIFISGPDSDEGASIGFGAGRVYDYGTTYRVRTDVEVLFRENRDFSTNTGAAPLAGTMFDVKVDQNWSVLGNVWLDYKITQNAILYGGGGLGVGGLRVSASNGVIAGRERETDFAFQVGGGMIYRFSETCEIDLGYRYLDTGRSTIGLYNGGARVGRYDIDQASGELMLTARYIFR